MNLLPVFSNAWSSLCVVVQFNHPKKRPWLRNVSTVFCTVYHHESCASNPDLKLQWKLCFKSWPWTSSCELCYEIDIYMLWHKPSNFTLASNFTAVFALLFSPTCQKAKFKRKIISIHTNSFIIITCPNPVLLVPGFGQVG